MAQTIEAGWLDLRAAAAYTSAGESTLRMAAASGELRGSKGPGNRRTAPWKFRRDDLDRWVEGLPPRKGGHA